MTTQHNERCKECKNRVYELLTKIFGKVKTNYNLNLPSKPDNYPNNPPFLELKKIFVLLQNHRGYENFIRSNKLPNVDFFIVNPGFILEFDETQHFTKPREITLRNYPKSLKIEFNRQKWIELCVKLHRKDNDPPYRDEQRAWYDTMRDSAPAILDLKPTIRLFAKDCIWCHLDPEKEEDINLFKKHLYLK